MTQYYQGPTGPLALRRTGHDSDDGVFYMLSDHLGSTSALVAQNGALSSTNYYHPYGEARSPLSSLTTRRFTGQYHEAALGLYFYGARWYDPLLGRFTQPDTIVPDPGDPQSLNRYSYAANNPVRYTDPSGHSYCVDEECDLVQHPHSGRMTARRSGIRHFVKTHYHVTMSKGFKPREKSAILSALYRFSEKAGGEAGVRKAFGEAVLVRWGSGRTNRGVYWSSGRKKWLETGTYYLPGTSHIFFDDRHFNQEGPRKDIGTEIGTIHELAHYWSDTTLVGAQSLDSFFDKYVDDEPEPTWYAETDLHEDWAESVAMYVYPVYENIIRTENKPYEMLRRNGFGPGLGILHKVGVSMFFESLRVDPLN